MPSDGIDIQEDLEACDAIIDSANQMERVANDVLGEFTRPSMRSLATDIHFPDVRPRANSSESARSHPCPL